MRVSTENMIKQGIVILNILLLAALLLAGAVTLQQLKALKTAKLPVQKPAVKPPAKLPETRYKPIGFYNPVFERNLFNTKDAPEEEIEPAIDIEALKETELKLKLLGTVATQNASAYAAIEDMKTRKQKLYRVGDKVREATIKRIFRETVVLNMNGEDSVLKMERKDSPAAKPDVVTPFDKSNRKPVRQKRVLSRALIDNAMSNSAQLMSQFNLEPHEVEGQVEGAVINRIKRNSIVMRMGLRNGDVISAVNGTPVDSIENTAEFMDSFMNDSTVSIDILRRGRPVSIEYTIK